VKHGGPNRPVPGLPFLLTEAEADAGDPDGPLSGAMVGEYRLVTRLAKGGMSEVWLADAVAGSERGKSVIVKRLLPRLRGLPDCVARFRAEAELGARLSHPNLARSFGLLALGADLFLAQELAGGDSLAQIAAAARKGSERLDPAAVVHAVSGLLAALSHLHGLRLVHADVNPDNLVARPDGSVKLIDLGLAQELSADGSVPSPDGALRGTPAYMSPEQVKSRPLDARSDLFSAAVALWELLANRPLFAAETEFETLRRVRELPAPPLRAVWPEAPTGLERILVRALSKDAASRFQSAADFSAELNAVAARSGLTSGPESLAAAVSRWAPRAPRPD
jgi:eukaryotic-like serine/threonine-protein kinase